MGASPWLHGKPLSVAKVFAKILPSGLVQKRELLFHVNMAKLLNDDVAFTKDSVKAEALRLLAGLNHFQHSCTEVSGNLSSKHLEADFLHLTSCRGEQLFS